MAKRANTAVRVLLAGASPLLRSALKELLAKKLKSAVFSESSSARNTLGAVRKNPFDVIILVFDSSEGLGLDVLDQIKREKPTLPVVVINLFPSDHEALGIIRARPDAYLGSHANDTHLLQGIGRVLHGKRFISPITAEKLLYQFSALPYGEALPALSSREIQVLSMLARGLKRGEIARTLALSPQTISSYRTRILGKLGLKTTSELIRYAMDNNFV